MKRTTLDIFAVVVLLGVAFAMGQVSRTPDIRQQRSDAYEAGITEMIQSVSDCTLEDAHAEKCFIPCGGDMDCEQKNGMRDR